MPFRFFRFNENCSIHTVVIFAAPAEIAAIRNTKQVNIFDWETILFLFFRLLLVDVDIRKSPSNFQVVVVVTIVLRIENGGIHSFVRRKKWHVKIGQSVILQTFGFSTNKPPSIVD